MNYNDCQYKCIFASWNKLEHKTMDKLKTNGYSYTTAVHQVSSLEGLAHAAVWWVGTPSSKDFSGRSTGPACGQNGCLHQWTTLGGIVSGGCATLLSALTLAVWLETQQQSGPALGQQLVQNVIQVQSGACPFVAQVE